MADSLRQTLASRRAWLLEGSSKTWMTPDIPGKKAKAAIAAYAHRVQEADILLLFDETLFGNADRGLILTETHIHVKPMFEPPASYALADVENIRAIQGVILVNGLAIIDLALAEKMTITRLCDLLAEYLECRSKPAPRHPQPAPVSQLRSLDKAQLDFGPVPLPRTSPPTRPLGGSGFPRNRVENSYFHRYRSRYVANLRNSVDNLQYRLYLGIYDAFMGIATQNPAGTDPGAALTWLLSDDETLFQSFILAVYCTGSQLSRHLDEDDVHDVLKPLLEVLFDLAREEVSRHPLDLETAIDPARAFMNTPRMQEFQRLHTYYKGALAHGDRGLELLASWFADHVDAALGRHYGDDYVQALQLAEEQGADFEHGLQQFAGILHQHIERLLIDFFSAIWQ